MEGARPSAWLDALLDRRRGALLTAANPRTSLDYGVRLLHMLDVAPHAKPVSVGIAYVPDRLVLEHDCFAPYAAVLLQQPWPSLEALAGVILDDINDALVPRWVEVRLGQEDRGGTALSIVMTDRQPGWTGDPPA